MLEPLSAKAGAGRSPGGMRLFGHQKAEIVTTAATVKGDRAGARRGGGRGRRGRAIFVPTSVTEVWHLILLPSCSGRGFGDGAIANGAEMSDLEPG